MLRWHKLCADWTGLTRSDGCCNVPAGAACCACDRFLRRRRVIDRFAGSPTHFSAGDKLVLHKWCWPTLSFPTFFFPPKRGFVVANVVLGAAAPLPAWRNTLCQSEFCSVKSHTTHSRPFWHFFIPHPLRTRPPSTLSPCSVDWSRYILLLWIRPMIKVSVSTDWFCFRLSVQTPSSTVFSQWMHKILCETSNMDLIELLCNICKAINGCESLNKSAAWSVWLQWRHLLANSHDCTLLLFF